MRLYLIPSSFLILLFILFPVNSSLASDVKGSSDHPLISRYKGSVIKTYDHKEFDEYQLLTGKAEFKPYPEVTSDNKKVPEGKVTRITYLNPQERSTLEVFSNYETELKNEGFEILFKCSDKECGGRAMNHAVVPDSAYAMMGENYDDQRYLAAKSEKDQKTFYVVTYVNSTPGGKVYTQLDIIEVSAMEKGMVSVDSEAMEKEITSEGSISIYGIHFDHDSAEIRESSKPTLEQIAKLLNDNPELNLFVVGHTDNEGSLEYNLNLSERRARAVVARLVNEYSIKSTRLSPQGVGFLAPVATNRTDKGRAKNRRVELVER